MILLEGYIVQICWKQKKIPGGLATVWRPITTVLPVSSDFYREKTFFPPFFLPSLFSLFPNLHEKFIRRFVCRPTLAKPSIHATLSTSRNILIAARAAAFQFASPPSPMSRARDGCEMTESLINFWWTSSSLCVRASQSIINWARRMSHRFCQVQFIWNRSRKRYLNLIIQGP